MKLQAATLVALVGMGAPVGAWAQTYSRIDNLAYEDNKTLWVIGMPKTSTTNGFAQPEYEHVYNANALPIETRAFGKTRYKATYYADGTLATVSDGRDSPTFDTTVAYAGWKRGIPQTITYPDGNVKRALVNDLGQITSVTDETNATTTYGYDLGGRLNRIDLPTGDQKSWHSTTMTFLPVATTEYGIPAGHWTQGVATGYRRKATYFDAMWRPLLVREYDFNDVAGTERFTRFEYDDDGRQVFASYPSATSSAAFGTRTEYDALGRVTKVTQDGVGLPTVTEYLSGFKTRVTNPRGKQTTTSYMAFDAPGTDWPRKIDAPGVSTLIVRDNMGAPWSITRTDLITGASSKRDYVYWGTGRELCGVRDPENGISAMGYDAAGNLAWSASGLPEGTVCHVTGDTAPYLARRISRSYDQRNRVASMTFPEQSGDTTYRYTPDGLLESLVTLNKDNATATTTYTYNKRRLLIAERLQVGSTIDWTVGYDYNNSGDLSLQGYPNNVVVSYAPNALGQATQNLISGGATYASGADYHPNGAVSRFTYGNGALHQLWQNARGLPDRSRDSHTNDTVVLLDDSYDYDDNGNVLAISDGRLGQRGNRTLEYDDLDRLTKAVSPMFNGTITYAYDGLDNITRVIAPARPATANVPAVAARNDYYCYDQKWQLTNIKTVSCATGSSIVGLEYDEQGNLKNKNGRLFEFDKGNRLRRIFTRDAQLNETTLATYAYDGHGRRVRATDTGDIYSMYAMDGTLLYQEDFKRNKRIYHMYLSGDPVAQVEVDLTSGAAANRYIHTDALGSPVVVTDGQAFELERGEYEPYGLVINRPLRDGPGYTGHVEDASSGLNYMQQRYYDPWIGTFLSVDPVGVSPAGENFNRYWYANNNPYRYTDPDGRQPSDCAETPCPPPPPPPSETPNPSRQEIAEQRRQQRLSDGGWSVSLSEWAAAHPAPQGLVDPVIGAGVGTLSGLSFGLINEDIMGIDATYADQDSLGYKAGNVTGTINGGGILGVGAARGLATLSNVQKLRWLNQNRWLRFGPGKPAGNGFIPKVPMVRIGPSPWNRSTPFLTWLTHWRL